MSDQNTQPSTPESQTAPAEPEDTDSSHAAAAESPKTEDGASEAKARPEPSSEPESEPESQAATEPQAEAPPAAKLEIKVSEAKTSGRVKKSFKGKAPAERQKTGSLGDRLREKHKADEQALMATRIAWAKRVVVLALLLLGSYWALGPWLRVKFYMSLANPNDPNWFYWSADKLADLRSEQAVPIFITGLRTEDRGRRHHYVNLIKEMIKPEHKALLLSRLKHPKADYRRATVYALFLLDKGDWVKDSFTDPLIQVLKAEPDHRSRRFAALIFEKYYAQNMPPKVAEALAMGVNDRDISVRRISLSALAQFDDSKYSKVFIRALQDDSGEVRWKAMLGLVKIGDPACIDALEIRYAQGDRDQRRRVVDVIGQLDHPDVVRFLIQVTESKDPAAAARAVDHLGNSRSKAANPAIVRALKSPHAIVRLAATLAVKKRGLKDAISQLIGNLGNYEGVQELQALDETLTKLTGVDVPAPRASEESCQATVTAWRAWYEKSKSS